MKRGQQKREKHKHCAAAWCFGKAILSEILGVGFFATHKNNKNNILKLNQYVQQQQHHQQQQQQQQHSLVFRPWVNSSFEVRTFLSLGTLL